MEEKNELRIVREFNAPQELVWKAHTEAEHLAKWWGPAGFKLTVAKLELKPGGIFHYGMEAPDGNKMWGRFVYREIVPKEKLVFVVSFSDENGGVTRHPMSDTWPLETLNIITLSEKNGKTTVTITGHPVNASAAEEETYRSAFEGMNQGFKGTYDQLEAHLENIQS